MRTNTTSRPRPSANARAKLRLWRWLGGALVALVPTVAVASGTELGSTAEIPVQRPTGMLVPAPSPVEPEPVAAPPTASAPPTSPAPDPDLGPALGPAPSTPAPAAPAKPPTEPAVDDLEGDPPSPHAALAEEAKTPSTPFVHRGAVADLRVGTLGCLGGFCRSDRHDVSPGVRLGGFLGGNVRGWFEAGIGGGWGTMKPHVTPGTNALLLYGLDPIVLQQALLAQAAGLLSVDLAGLAVSDAQLRAAQVGPTVRVHLIPRGRVHAFVGTGVGYNRLRSRYQTAAGDVRLDFHGIDVPVEANVGVYVLPNVALGVQFDYMWTWYGAVVLDHPQQRLALPLSVLQAAGQQQGIDVRGQLPQMWSVGLALRGRL